MDSRMNAWTWSLLVLLGLIWGGSFFFARIAVQHVPPLTLVFLRLLLAAVALHLYIAGRFDFYSILKARWREFLLLGLINNALPHALIFFGQTRIGAGLAAILNATTPIWTVLIANYLTSDEKLSSAKIAGCLVGLAGTIMLIGPGISSGGEAPLWALLLPVLAAISYGFAATYGKRFKNVPAPVTAAGQLTASSLITLPLSLVADRPWTLPLPGVGILLAILALALVSTAFAYILYFRIMAAAGATNASLVTLLVPPSAILLGVLFLGEGFTLGEFAGMALIGFGLVILDGRAYHLLTRTA
ncbi:putative permease, DMT superfamily [Rhizobium leguminosarum bv. trifolii WSM2297]|uniref:Putative permease, DMT superfamily n=1 Tax=Rhizobium leguminosarum bv. trifolii WSM2297 TaxID=754762 RepID=J0W3N8_RHILT|nr:DMT family transporter [Rhizobium leguminosarum]EJC80331.1 putative permease, DMT superfamily [Rhizobium leguminosarum bv. trifolii WSM2297]